MCLQERARKATEMGGGGRDSKTKKMVSEIRELLEMRRDECAWLLETVWPGLSETDAAVHSLQI